MNKVLLCPLAEPECSFSFIHPRTHLNYQGINEFNESDPVRKCRAVKKKIDHRSRALVCWYYSGFVSNEKENKKENKKAKTSRLCKRVYHVTLCNGLIPQGPSPRFPPAYEIPHIAGRRLISRFLRRAASPGLHIPANRSSHSSSSWLSNSVSAGLGSISCW